MVLRFEAAILFSTDPGAAKVLSSSYDKGSAGFDAFRTGERTAPAWYASGISRRWLMRNRLMMAAALLACAFALRAAEATYYKIELVGSGDIV
jgi:hypothetical protein